MRPALLAVLVLVLAGCGTSQPVAEPAPQVSGLQSALSVLLPSPDLAVRLTGDGIDLPSRPVAFGDTLDDALIGDALAFDFGPGTTVTEPQKGAGPALELLPGDEQLGPAFRLTDRSSGFFGTLSSPTGVVDAVQAGKSCGE